MYDGLYFKLMVVALIFWVFVFFRRKAQRKDMLWTGVLAAIAGPIQELWYTKDYWHPQYIGGWPWIEDILFGFAVMGVCAALYEIIFYRHVEEVRDKKSHPFVFVVVAFIALIGMVLFTPFMNSIYAAMIAFLIAWSLTIFVRPDLFKLSVFTALLVLVFTFVSYQLLIFFKPLVIRDWWLLNNISGVLFWGVPLEEFMWFGAMGLALGPLYELYKGIRVVKIREI